MTAPKASETVRAAAEAACAVIARVEGWTSAPVKESVYEAGFLAGALAFSERAAKLAEGAYGFGSWDDEDAASEIDRAQAKAGNVIAAAIRALATDAGDGK
jgi:hypothetical protein